MSDNPFLNWVALSASLFNAILLLWLGGIVLLNAERRAYGIWIAGAGLLLGGGFFVSHAAILQLGLFAINPGMVFWWTVGLVPAIALPYAWYLVMRWYAGYGLRAGSRRQSLGMVLTTLLFSAGMLAVGIGVFLLANLFSPNPLLQFLRVTIRWSVAGIPLLAVGYSCYVILCVLLALDTLVRPGPSERMLGTLARERAQPWLVATSIGMLLVSLVTVSILLLIVQSTRDRFLFDFYQEQSNRLALIDLLVTGLIGAIILLLGQAVVAYEVFTGVTLPRRGLLRHWRGAIALSAAYSLLTGGALVLAVRPVYSLLLTVILMTSFFVLFSWQSFRERDRLIEYLRPFVSGPRLYDQLLAPAEQTDSHPLLLDVQPAFDALCADLLDTDRAYLVGLGSMASLLGAPLSYPRDSTFERTLLPPLIGEMTNPQQLILPVAPPGPGNARWAVPLWSERGLIGVLLLGDRRTRGLYTREEIAVARATGERLIDLQASGGLAQRLMTLQRQRLAESQIIDRRSRRVLHDEVLPHLHTAMLLLSSGDGSGAAETLALLGDAHREIATLLRDLPPGVTPAVGQAGLLPALRSSISGEFKQAFDEVRWDLPPAAVRAAAELTPLTAEVVFYAAREAIRNAAKYGRGPDPGRALRLTIRLCAEPRLRLEIEDDGVGVRELFPPAEASESGQGLTLHGTMMAVVGGELSFETIPGSGARVSLLI